LFLSENYWNRKTSLNECNLIQFVSTKPTSFWLFGIAGTNCSSFLYRVGGNNCPLLKVVPLQNHSMLFNKILFLTARHVHSTHQLLWHFVSNLGQAGFEFGQSYVFCAAEFGQSVFPMMSSPACQAKSFRHFWTLAAFWALVKLWIFVFTMASVSNYAPLKIKTENYPVLCR
jgi:hypothetical protein